MEGEKEAEDVLLEEDEEQQGQRQTNKKKNSSSAPIDAEEADEMERLDLTYVLFDNLPSEESERLIKIAKEGKDEQILFIEQPSFWISNRSLICVSVAGSAAFLLAILLILAVGLNWEFLMLGIFVIILGITMMGYRKKRFVILTSEKIIIYKQRSPAIIVPYDSLVTVTNRLNWLLWMRELELRKRESGKFSPTTISKQSGIKQEFIDGFSSLKLKEIEDFIVKQLPAYQGDEDEAQEEV